MKGEKTETGGIGLWTLERLFLIPLAVAAVLLALLPVFPGETIIFAVSNAAQVMTAAACSLACAWIYRYWCRDTLFVLAGLAFFGWTLSNIFWYLWGILEGEALSYPTTAEAGFLGFMLLAGAAFQITFPERKEKKMQGTARFAAVLLISAGAIPIILGAPAAAALVTFIAYAICASFLLLSVTHTEKVSASLFAGSLLYCAAICIYTMRETFGWQNPVFFVAGPLVIVGFATIMRGLISVLRGCYR